MLYKQNDKFRPYQESTDKVKYNRPRFWRDYQRIISSPAFRRLSGKTQLYPGHESDFFRNRLTHSLEVAHIGKSIALNINQDLKKHYRKVGIDISTQDDNFFINTDLVQAACIAHDIGHPPFGHQGEEALNSKMKSFGGFEGNAQTLRILSKLEKKTIGKEVESGEYHGLTKNCEDNRFGLNLTYRTYASILKYDNLIESQLENSQVIKGFYREEEDLVTAIKKQVLGKPNPPKNWKFKTIECSIMDIADDIAYSTYDFEDALKGGFVTPLDYIFLNESLITNISLELLKDYFKNDIRFKNHFNEILIAESTTDILTRQKEKCLTKIKSINIQKDKLLSSTSDLTNESFKHNITVLDFKIKRSESLSKFIDKVLLIDPHKIKNINLICKNLEIQNFDSLEEYQKDVLTIVLNKYIQTVIKNIFIDVFKVNIENLKIYFPDSSQLFSQSDILSVFVDIYKKNKDTSSIAYLRTMITSNLVKKAVNDIRLIKSTKKPMCIWAVDYKSKDIRFQIYVLKKLNYHMQIESNVLKIVEGRGKQIVSKIFEEIIRHDCKYLPEDYYERYHKFIMKKEFMVDLINSNFTDDSLQSVKHMVIDRENKIFEQNKHRLVCDFVSSMTDKYALKFYSRLFSENAESIFRKVE